MIRTLPIVFTFALSVVAALPPASGQTETQQFDVKIHTTDGVVAKHDLSHAESQVLRQVAKTPKAKINRMSMALPSHYTEIRKQSQKEKTAKSSDVDDGKQVTEEKSVSETKIPEKLKPKIKKAWQPALDNVYPIIVPGWYFDGDSFPALTAQLKDSRFSLVWVEYQDGSMTYLRQQDVAGFEKNGVDWKQKAIENLQAATPKDFGTKISVKADDKSIETWALLSAGDPISSSRLLLSDRLKEFAPDGYQIAICSRDVAIVVPLQATKKQKGKISDQVLQIFESRWNINEWPMCTELLPSNSFELWKQTD